MGLIEAEQGRLFNTAIVVDRGTVIGRYRKRHLLGGEHIFDAGSESNVFEVEGLRFGINICHDTNFPAAARNLADLGAALIVCPANNMHRRKTAPALSGRARRRHSTLSKSALTLSASFSPHGEEPASRTMTARAAPRGRRAISKSTTASAAGGGARTSGAIASLRYVVDHTGARGRSPARSDPEQLLEGAPGGRFGLGDGPLFRFCSSVVRSRAPCRCRSRPRTASSRLSDRRPPC